MTPVGIRGLVIAELWRPDRHGELILADHQEMPNLVTQAGDQAYGDALAGLNANATVTDPSPPVAMQLGTGTTAVAKTGAGAAIVTYISGSNQVFPVTYPQSSLNGASRRISYQAIWIAGDSTNAAIAEAVIVTISTDGAASAAQTYSRTVFGATIDKQAGDTLTVTWHHDLLGA
jgi:FtsP/CotA-like multicopper oxidase with cupredoxin domain